MRHQKMIGKPGAAIALRQNRRGFTLLEMIMVIGTIAFLMAFLAVMTGRAQRQSSIRATEEVIKQVEMALQNYYDTFGKYPAKADDPPELYKALVDSKMIQPASLAVDKNNDGEPMLVDAWRGPIRVVVFPDNKDELWNINGGQPMVFSTGPDRNGWNNGKDFKNVSAAMMRKMIVKPGSGANRDNLTNFRDITKDGKPLEF